MTIETTPPDEPGPTALADLGITDTPEGETGVKAKDIITLVATQMIAVDNALLGPGDTFQGTLNHPRVLAGQAEIANT